VNLGTAFGVHLDWQCLPLAARVKQLQDVIENRVQRKRWSGSTSASAQMWQDKLLKLLKLLKAQFRWNRLPVLTCDHPLHPQIRTLTDSTAKSVKPSSQKNLAPSENRNQLVDKIDYSPLSTSWHERGFLICTRL